jgi:hypothetical protein
MFAQRGGGGFGITLRDGLHNFRVFFVREHHAVAHAQLQASVGAQAAVKLLRLFAQKCVVAAFVNGGVEQLVAIKVGV